MADWLVQTLRVDARRIGVAGHSMGGKDAILAATAHGGFAGVVAIDPDDAGELSVVRGQLSQLRAPLLLIGAEVAWQAASICASLETNYLRFFEHAPPGTVELTLRGADHVQMLDEPDRFGYGICRVGTANSAQVHDITLDAVVGFFVQHLQGGAGPIKVPVTQASIRVAQVYGTWRS
jgi:dienelactone hydrolase